MAVVEENLFNYISEEKILKLKVWENTHISLLSKVSEIEINRSVNSKTHLPVKKLWDLIYDSKIGTEKQKFAMEHFNSILTSPKFTEDLKLEFFKQACVNIQSYEISTFLVMMMENIVKSFSEVQENHFFIKPLTMGEFVKKFNKKYDLVSLMVTELTLFKEKVLQFEKENKGLSVKYEGMGLSEHIKKRLDFLRLISKNLNNSEFFTIKHIDELWESIVANSTNPEEQNIFFDFASSIQLNTDVSQTLFYKLMEISSETITKSTFNFFKHQCFEANKSVNNLEGNEDMFYLTTTSDSEIFGIDKIWEIALKCRDIETSNIAIDFLLDFQMLKPSLVTEHGMTKRKSFIEKCIKQIKESKDMQMKERCIAILQEFLKLIEGNLVHELLPFERHSLAISEEPEKIRITVSEGVEEKQYFIEVEGKNSVYYLRKKISEVIGKEIGEFNIISHSQMQQVQNNAETIEEIGVLKNKNMQVLLEAPPNRERLEESGETIINKELLPSFILARHFESLYDLLPQNPKIASRVWDLLQQMPTNEQILQKLQTVFDRATHKKAFNWDHELNTSCQYQLIYNLQVIVRIVQQEQRKIKQAEEDHRKTKTQFYAAEMGFWSTQFVKTGGIEYLFQLLFKLSRSEIKLDLSDKAPVQETVAVLLQIIAYFVVDDRKDDENKGNEDDKNKPLRRIKLRSVPMKKNQFVPFLLEFVQRVCIGKIGENQRHNAKKIVFYSMRILEAGASTDREWSNLVKNFAKLQDFFKNTTLICEEKNIRQLVIQAIIRMASQVEHFQTQGTIGRKSMEIEKFPKKMEIEKKDEKQPILLSVFLQMALKILEQMQAERKQTTPTTASPEDYFSLLRELIRQGYRYKSTQRFDDLVVLVARLIKEQPVSESILRMGSGSLSREGPQQDDTLIGYFQLLLLLLQSDPRNRESLAAQEPQFLEHLLGSCLFSIGVSDNGELIVPKCQMPDTRRIAYSVVFELVKGNEKDYLHTLDRLSQLHQQLGDLHVWNYSPRENQKSDTGYSGLTNLGSTCYMNSLIQQLFVIPEFRQRFLTANISSDLTSDLLGDLAANIPKHLINKNLSDLTAIEGNLFAQLQLIIAQLMATENKFVDTKGFCSSYTDWAGNPLDITVQMDADEFLNILFDKLDSALATTNQHSMLRDIFGGRVANQIIPHGEADVSERIQNFYTISLEVANKKNILESLELFVRGEMLVGDNQYYSEQLGKKVDATMRTCIEKLPKILILHLKRFEFNLETMERIKVSDECSFPFELNMRPFTKEGVKSVMPKDKNNEMEIEKNKNQKYEFSEKMSEDSHSQTCYDYELKGILVHDGTTQSGHYYSFIRVRVGDPKLHTSDIWIRFEDKNITYYNPTDIPFDSFGGRQEIVLTDDGEVTTHFVEKTFSAYMLFYRRKDYGAEETFNLGKEFDELNIHPLFTQKIWKDNMQNYLPRLIFDLNHFEFLSKLVSLDDFIRSTQLSDSAKDLALIVPSHLATAVPQKQRRKEIEARTIEFVVAFVVQILARSKNKRDSRQWLTLVNQKLSDRDHCEITKKLLGQNANAQAIRTIVLECPDKDIRQGTLGCIVTAVLGVLDAEKDQIAQTINRRKLELLDRFSGITKLTQLFDVIDFWSQQLSSMESERVEDKTDSSALIFLEYFMREMTIFQKDLKNGNRLLETLQALIGIAPPLQQYFIYRMGLAKLVNLHLDAHSPLKGEEISQDVYHEAQMKTKTSEIGEKIVDVIYTTILGTDLTTHLPQNRTEQQRVETTLIDKYFFQFSNYAKMLISEGINPTKVGEIIYLLCFGSREKTQGYIDFIKRSIQRNDFGVIERYFQVLGAFFSGEDELSEFRGETIMRILVSFILNSKGSVLKINNSIQYITNLAKDHKSARLWLLVHREEWIDKFLVEHDEIDTRKYAGRLVGSLLPDEPTEEDVPQMIAISEFLMSLLPSLCTRTYSRIEKHQSYRNNDPWPAKFFKLTEYFDLLGKFIPRSQCIHLFSEYFSDIWNLYNHIDTKNLYCDLNKQHLMMFLGKCFDYSPDLIHHISKSQEKMKDLIRYFISLNKKESYVTYNRASLPHYFRILRFCVEHNNALVDSLYDQSTFVWAIKYLMLDPIYSGVDDIILEICIAMSSKYEFKKNSIQLILCPKKSRDNFEQDYLFTAPKNALRMLDLCVDTKTLDLFTVDKSKNGHKRVSDLLLNEVIKNLKSQIEELIRAEYGLKKGHTKNQTQSKSQPKQSLDSKIKSSFELLDLAIKIILKTTSWFVPITNDIPENLLQIDPHNILSLWSNKLPLLKELSSVVDIIDINYPDQKTLGNIFTLLDPLISLVQSDEKGIKIISSIFSLHYSKLAKRDEQKSRSMSPEQENTYLYLPEYQHFLITLAHTSIDIATRTQPNSPDWPRSTAEIFSLVLFYLLDTLHQASSITHYFAFVDLLSSLIQAVDDIPQKTIISNKSTFFSEYQSPLYEMLRSPLVDFLIQTVSTELEMLENSSMKTVFTHILSKLNLIDAPKTWSLRANLSSLVFQNLKSSLQSLVSPPVLSNTDSKNHHLLILRSCVDLLDILSLSDSTSSILSEISFFKSELSDINELAKSCSLQETEFKTFSQSLQKLISKFK
eukprot:Anaeramoba_ignava/a347738_295.p1 GENE.a347738_295~~a347738_295.p1  ORF type:complete len:3015 (+),score=860.58 a347738_295:1233-9047(+)